MLFVTLIIFGFLLSGQTTKESKPFQELYEYLQQNQKLLQWTALGVETQPEFDIVKLTCLLDKTEQLFEIAKKFNADKSLFEKLNEEQVIFSFYFKKTAVEVKKEEGQKKAEKSDDCPSRIKVYLVKPSRADFVLYKHYSLVFSGRVVPVVVEQEGVVSEVLFKAKEKFKAGQTLVVFNEGIEKEKEKLLADIKKLEKKIQQKKATKKEEQQYLKLTQDYKSIESLKEFALTAEFDGEVEGVLVGEGQKVFSGQRVLMLADYRELYARVKLSEEDRSLWQENEEVVIRIDHGELVARVVSLAEDRAVLKLDNSNYQIPVPLKREIKKSWKKFNAVILVAEKSLLTDEQGKKYLYGVKSGRAVKIYPEIAAIYNGQVAISSGLKDNQKIIAEPDACLKQGKKVKPLKSEVKTDEYKTEALKKGEPQPETEVEPFKMSLMGGIYFEKMRINDENFAEFYKKEKNFPSYALAFSFYNNVDLTANLRFYSDKNVTVSTQEEIQFKLTALSLGARYRLPIRNSNFSPYAQAGINFFSYQELNPIEDFKDKAVGFYLGGGVFYKIYSFINLDLFVKYNFVKDKYDDPAVSLSELNLSGFEIGLGIVLKFEF